MQDVPFRTARLDPLSPQASTVLQRPLSPHVSDVGTAGGRPNGHLQHGLLVPPVTLVMGESPTQAHTQVCRLPSCMRSSPWAWSQQPRGMPGALVGGWLTGGKRQQLCACWMLGDS